MSESVGGTGAEQMITSERECVKCAHIWRPGVSFYEPCPNCEGATQPKKDLKSAKPSAPPTEPQWDGSGHFYAENRTDFKGWEPVADGGGLPPLDVTESDLNIGNCAADTALDFASQKQTHAYIKNAVAELECRERQLAASQEALRLARELSTAREMEARRLMWITHGHFGIYGDDGEMQCGSCAKYGCWDYKNSPWHEVISAYNAAILERAASPEGSTNK